MTERDRVLGRAQLLAELHQLLAEAHRVLGVEPELKARGLVRASPVLELHADVHGAIGGGELAKPHFLERRHELHGIAHRTAAPGFVVTGSVSRLPPPRPLPACAVGSVMAVAMVCGRSMLATIAPAALKGGLTAPPGGAK